jgi:hypothetical protein
VVDGVKGFFGEEFLDDFFVVLEDHADRFEGEEVVSGFYEKMIFKSASIVLRLIFNFHLTNLFITVIQVMNILLIDLFDQITLQLIHLEKILEIEHFDVLLLSPFQYLICKID